jgi:hypothetical protein
MYVSNVPFVPQDEPPILVQPREKALDDAARGVRPTSIGRTPAEYAIAVAVDNARVAVGRRIVAFVGVKWCSIWNGKDGGSECRLQEAHVRLVAGRTEKRVRHTFVVNGSGELGGHTASVGRVATDAVHAIDILDKCGIDAAVARPPTPSIQPEETFVGSAEESSVDPFVHGLEDCDVSDSSRWAKVAPLDACAYDAQDVVVRVVEAKKSGSPPCGRRKGLLDCNTKYIFEHSTITLCEIFF